MYLQVPVASSRTAFVQFSLFIPAKQTPSSNVPAPFLFKQPKHFMVLPWKRANHLRAERETFLSRAQPNQNQKLSVCEPCLEYLFLNAHICSPHVSLEGFLSEL